MTGEAQREYVGNDEPRWHASLAALAALALYVTLPPKVTFGPVWIVPLLVLVILVPLSIVSPIRKHESPWQRLASIAAIVVLNLFNIISVVLLIVAILHPSKSQQFSNGAKLLTAGLQIWITNILVFAMWYWELDAGGPEARAHARSFAEFQDPAFLFPQMAVGDAKLGFIDPEWKPLFMDYLFLAFTNASAFSPADTFPLSRIGKALMMAEAFTSFVTIGVVVSRAVGIIA
ncbi:MAG: hypothetical protein ABR584_04600 [Candidatus Baltobacteraceae bacterium]